MSDADADQVPPTEQPRNVITKVKGVVDQLKSIPPCRCNGTSPDARLLLIEKGDKLVEALQESAADRGLPLPSADEFLAEAEQELEKYNAA